MSWYGIKVPETCSIKERRGIIRWVTNSKHNSWWSFFHHATNLGNQAFHALPIEEAIRAYEAIGYKCVELEIKEVMTKEIEKEDNE